MAHDPANTVHWVAFIETGAACGVFPIPEEAGITADPARATCGRCKRVIRAAQRKKSIKRIPH